MEGFVGGGPTRRQFIGGSLVLSGLTAGSLVISDEPSGDGGYGDVELCLLRFVGFLEPLVTDGPETPSFVRRQTERMAEADFVRGLKVGDLLSIGVIGEEDLRESGIGDTGVSSLLRLGFMEEGQVGLLESVADEASRGTSLYAVVREAFYTPGIDFLRHVWLSVHSEMTPANRERLLAIRGSEEARARADELESDMFAQRLLEALDSGGPLPPP